jgi:hypothetical protein
MSMFDSATAIQDQVLDAMKVGEGAVLSALKSVSDKAGPVTARWPKPPFADRMPASSEVVGSAFDLAGKVLAHQKDFAVKLLDAVTPGSKPAPTTARKPRGNG